MVDGANAPAASTQHAAPPRNSEAASSRERRGIGSLVWEFVTHLPALLAAALAIAALVVGIRHYLDVVRLPGSPRPPAKDTGMISFEVAGSNRGEVHGADPSHIHDALRANWGLIGGCGLALVIGAALAWWLVSAHGVHRAVRFGAFTAVVAIACGCIENAFLFHALAGHRRLIGLNCYDTASTLAIVKYCALVPATITAAFGIGVAVTRSFTFPSRKVLTSADASHPVPILLADAERSPRAGDRGNGATTRWRRAFDVPECTHAKPSVQNGEVTGVCLSGGGVRAASVAMGVLQSANMRRVLPHTQYLVSVSGGGYTSGAFAQLLTSARPEDLNRADVIHDPATAFLVGTPEEDHVRRHSSYLASTPIQLLRALGLLAQHLLLTLSLLFGPAIVFGVAAGMLYYRFPITLFSQTVALAPAHATDPALPHVRTGTGIALSILVVLAALLWLAAQFGAAHSTHAGRIRRGLSASAIAVGRLAAVVAILTVGLPAIIWGSAWLLNHTQGGWHVGAPIAGVLVTYLANLASLFWRKRSVFKKAKGTVPSAVPRGVTQIALVIVTMLALMVGWLLLYGGMATVGLHAHVDRSTVLTVAALLVLLLLLGGLADETTLSLHPFYRKRLASAFAVRRVRRNGHVVAVPYASTERTTLSTHGVQQHPTQFPHIIFAASATVGEQRTPPGSDRVSYTFCADWVGGPDVGYVRTSKLEELVGPRLRRDLTVQGAVALSGAAIAASLGGQGSAWYESLFVVSGARLGAWMPNPGFMIDRYAQRRSISRHGLPRIRRMNYLLRELFGIHPPDGPLLQVTDGGFYDNLGLVELLRRGCTRIYCVDASGDSPPAATTLAQTITLAQSELGVQIDLDGDTWSTATAGSGDAMQPTDPMKDLSARLSKSGIITGTITYPPCGKYAGKTGKLIVAKASLWSELPYELLAYAQDTNTFPHDSTADQFFDDQQYSAYTELGRQLGPLAVQAMTPPPPVSGLWQKLSAWADSVFG